MTSFRGKIGILLTSATAILLAAGFSSAAPTFTAGIQTGTLQNSSLTEASGIAASRMNVNVLWSHNDSGDKARVYPMTAAGTNLGVYTLVTIDGTSTTPVDAIDCEDIAEGPGPMAGLQYLYLADIGGNGVARNTPSTYPAVYRFAEPTVSDTQSATATNISGWEKLTLKYPDTLNHDAESMFVDPLTLDIYIITKNQTPSEAVYRAAYPQSTSGTTTMQLLTTLAFPGPPSAADISPNGNEILVRYDTNMGRLYTRPAGGTILDAFSAGPITVPIAAEANGEAIAFDAAGSGYFTTSEGAGEPVYYFNRNAPPTMSLYWDSAGAVGGNRTATGAGLGGSGTWNTTSLRWYNGSANIPWQSGNDAVFWGSAGKVMLASALTANSLTFKTTGYEVAGSSLQLSGPSVTVDSGVIAHVSSIVTGSAGLTKSGSGTLKLSNTNIYTGGTTISDGTLVVINTTGSATGAGAVAVGASGILGGTGIVQGNVTNDGTVQPGSILGTLHLGGTFTQNAGGRLEIELASLAAHDELAVIGPATLGGTLAVSLSGGFTPQVGNSFELMTAATFGGSTFTTTELATLSGDLAWSLNYGANLVTLLVTYPGDFNHDLSVDSADYAWWREYDGTQAGYDVWRSHFGLAAGSGAAISTNVPEPPALWTITCAIVIALGWVHLSRVTTPGRNGRAI